MGKDIMEQLTLFQEDSPVSPSHLPDKDSAVKMTVIYGRKCSGLLTKSDPLGSLAKMLLESSVWYSPVCNLVWQCKPILEKKIRRSLRSMNSSSKQSVRILSESDIPSSRFLFQLAVQVRHTGATESGLLPTPVAQYGGRKFRPGKKIITKTGQKFRPDLQQLASAGLLPTPTARDWKGAQARSYNQERIDNLPGLIRFRLGKTGQLNPLFVGEMMGFPDHWLTSPFLNGEKKDLNPSEMR